MGGTAVRISPETLVNQAEATGFRPDMLEKVDMIPIAHPPSLSFFRYLPKSGEFFLINKFSDIIISISITPRRTSRKASGGVLFFMTLETMGKYHA
jgi:hypothetical protein